MRPVEDNPDGAPEILLRLLQSLCLQANCQLAQQNFQIEYLSITATEGMDLVYNQLTATVLNVGVLICPEFQAVDLAVITVFEQANLLTGQPVYEVELISEAGAEVRGSGGLSVLTAHLSNFSFDTLIVLGANDCRPPGPDVIEYLRGAPRRIFVNDGQLWTSAGMSTGIDMALTMVEKDRGAEAAQAIARNLVLYHRRGGGQSQFSALLHTGLRSDRVQAAISFAKEHLNEELAVSMLAAIARLSPRQFTRVLREETGLSPAKAVERLRVEAARLMLETSRHSLEIIARETGFGDRDRMRLSFLRAFGQPPRAILRNGAADPV